jgi:hypothetical protein
MHRNGTATFSVQSGAPEDGFWPERFAASCACCVCRASSTLNLAPTALGQPKNAQHTGFNITATRALWIYLWYGNIFMVTACFIFFLAAQTTRQISDFWVRWWVADKYDKFENPKEQDSSATQFYSLMYMMLVLLFWAFMMFRGATFFGAVLMSAERLRKKALHK